MKDEPIGAPPLPSTPDSADKPAQDIVNLDSSDKMAASTDIVALSDDTVEDLATAEAVDDIARTESDEVLAAEDKELSKAFDDQKPSFKDKIKHFLSRWWNNPKARLGTIVGAIILVLTLLTVPHTRYFLLNSVSVRAKSSVKVMDSTTLQPLKKVHVSLGNQSAETDNEGVAKLSHLRLGPQQLTIEKRAFAPLTRNVTLGWGSNPLGSVNLVAVGEQYKFLAIDFLSGKPVDSAEASSGEANAQANEKGEIVLVIDSKGEGKLTATVGAPGYRSEEVALNETDKNSRTIKLVPVQKDVFISKRSGKYDVYKIDVDGKNEQVLLRATGTERDDSVLAVSPSGKVAALVSTRENVRNQDNFLLSTLTLIDVASGETTKVAQSERLQLIDWFGERLVYVRVAQGASAADNKRQRLVTYDTESNENKELASSNYFNDVLSAGGSIYYSPSSYQVNGAVGLFKISADGNGKQTIFNQEVWNILRADYDNLNFSVQQTWYTYQLGGTSTNKVTTPPTSQRSRIYTDSADKKHSLWTEERDGKGVLLAYDVSTKTDKVLKSQSGLTRPLRWLSNNTVLYRVHTDQETADYVINIDGGNAVKVRDVTSTNGIDAWYYY